MAKKESIAAQIGRELSGAAREVGKRLLDGPKPTPQPPKPSNPKK
jgi:hypothetical protein